APVIKQLLVHFGRRYHLAGRAVSVLISFDDEESWRSVDDLAHDPDPEWRELVLRSMIDVPLQGHAARLVREAEVDPDPDVRETACRLRRRPDELKYPNLRRNPEDPCSIMGALGPW